MNFDWVRKAECGMGVLFEYTQVLVIG
jgi:hypothetical protein